MTRLGAKNGATQAYYEKMVLVETDECILWPFNANRKGPRGYGILNGTPVHRQALTFRAGKAPTDKPLALHKPIICHNRACFNYRHLYWGTSADNYADSILDKTANRGARHAATKLTNDQVLAIFTDKRTFVVIAAEYGICPANVWHIKAGRSWRWLTLSSYRRPHGDSEEPS